MTKRIIHLILKNWALFILAFFILIYIVVFSYLSILRHHSFSSNYDLANMTQTVWNSAYGDFFSLTGPSENVSRFSIHADLILILFLPIYLIWEKASSLLIIQSIALGLAALPVYFLSFKLFSSIENINKNLVKIISLVFSIVFLLNPGMQWTNMYDFHGVAFAIPFLLCTFYFAYIKNWRWFWLFTVLALLTKEHVGFTVFMYGLTIAFVFKQFKMGFLAAGIGLIWSLLMFFVVIPYFSSSGTHWAFEWFQFDQPGTNETTMIPSAQNLIDKVYNYNSAPYYNLLLKPFAYIPLLGLPWLVLGLPDLAINVLSRQAQMQSIYFHYDSVITPALIIATIFGTYYSLLLVRRIKILRKYSYYLLSIGLLGLLFYSARVNYHYSPLPTTPSCWCLMYQVGADERAFMKLLSSIPQSASVAASGEVRPHVSKRLLSFTLPNEAMNADYVALIDQNRIVGDHKPKIFENELMQNPEFLARYDLVEKIGHFSLYKRK